MKKKLNIDDHDFPLTWWEVVSYYFPGCSDTEFNHVLWGKSPYPFGSVSEIHEAIWNHYQETLKY